jgi:hypothetical protein
MPADSIVVTHYGVHWDRDNVAYLMQGRGGTNAIGSATRPPFRVERPGRSRHCNHQIPLATPVPNDHHAEYFLQMFDDPLVQAMLPRPKEDGGVYYIEETPYVLELLVLLSKLSSPIYGVVQPLWNMPAQRILDELDMTNVQPLVVVSCEAKDSGVINQIAKMAIHKPRVLILAGNHDVVTPPQVKRIKTSIKEDKFQRNDLMTLPWEMLGAWVIRKYMRGEWPPTLNPKTGSYERDRQGSRRTA